MHKDGVCVYVCVTAGMIGDDSILKPSTGVCMCVCVCTWAKTALLSHLISVNLDDSSCNMANFTRY